MTSAQNMAWGSKFSDMTNSHWIVVVVAPKMVSGGILVAPGMDLPEIQTLSGCRLFSFSGRTSTSQNYFQLICTLSYLILLDLRKFVLPFYSHFTDEESEAQKGEGTSLWS